MSRRGLITLSSAIITIAVLAACAPAPAPTPASVLSTVAPKTTTQPNSAPGGMSNNASGAGPSMGTPVPRPTPLGVAQVAQAKEDLSKRLSVPASQVELVSGQIVTWRDSSLGCPKPGMAYSQVLTEGYLIQLAASGKLFQYHSSKSGAPFLCDNPQPPAYRES